MPDAPKRPCKRCRKVLTRDPSGYCDQCSVKAKQRETAKRKHYNKFQRDPVVVKWLNSARYRTRRKAHLEKNPLCVECQQKGKIRKGAILDHIIPHKGNSELFWDESNWQTMCWSCHSSKTNKYDGGFGNEIRS